MIWWAPWGRLSDLMIDFAQKAGKPLWCSFPAPVHADHHGRLHPGQGLETYAYRTWKETRGLS